MARPLQLQSPARVKVIIFGASGMIGAGALLECFADPDVARVLAVVRKPTGLRHAKLEEVVHADFFDYAPLQPRWPDFDACLFCLGVTSVGMDEPLPPDPCNRAAARPEPPTTTSGKERNEARVASPRAWSHSD